MLRKRAMTLLAFAAAVILASCATIATAPQPSTIDINNTTVVHTSPIQLGDAGRSPAAEPAPRANAR